MTRSSVPDLQPPASASSDRPAPQTPPPATPDAAKPGRTLRWIASLALLALLLGLTWLVFLAGSGEQYGLVVLPPEVRDPGSLTAEDVARLAAEDRDPSLRRNFHDFGNVPDGEVVEHTFRLLNTDHDPVTIRSANASCGCTVPSLGYRDADGELVEGQSAVPGEVLRVPPGTVMELTLRVDTHHVATKNRDKLVSVHLATSSLQGAYRSFEAHVIADLAFQAVPESIDLGEVPAGGGGVGSTAVIQDGATGAVIDGLAEVPEGVAAEIQYEERMGQPHWIVNATLEPPLELGRIVRTLKLATRTPDGEPGPPFRLKLTALVVRDLTVTPQRLLIRSSDPNEVILKARLPGMRVRILSSAVEGEGAEHLDLELEPYDLDPSGSSSQWTVRLTRSSALDVEVAAGNVVLQLDDAQYPSLEIPYVCYE